MRGARTRGWYYFPYDSPTREKVVSISNRNDQWRRLVIYGNDNGSNEINSNIVEAHWLGDSVNGVCKKESDKINYMSNPQRLSNRYL